MAAYTSSGSGNWNAAATWGGSGVPGSGDTVTIATGHTITVTANQAVGASGNSDTTAAVLVQGTGQLVISTGVTFTAKGDVTTSQTFANNSYVVMNAGSSWVWSVPSGQYYRAGSANTFGFNRFTINGSSGSRCSVSVTGGGGAFFSFDTVATGAYIGGGSLVATYTDFVGIGDSSHPGVNIYPYQYSGGKVTYSVQNCTFTTCGVITNGGYAWAANSTMLHKANTHTNTQNTNSCLVMATTNSASPGTGTWEISYNVFDQMLGKLGTSSASIMAGVTIKQNYLTNGMYPNVAGGSWALFDKNFVPGILDLNTVGPVTNSVWYENNHSNNPHFINLNHLAPGVTFSGNIFEHNGEYGVNGDCILTDSGAAASVAYTISGNVYLPCAVGDTSGSLVTYFGNDAYTTLTISHNTHCAGGEGGLAFESGSWTAGHLTSFKNNIFWATPANVAYRYKCYVASGYSIPLTQDIGAPSNVDYNCGYNLLATYADSNFLNQGKGYAASWSVTPGAHDLSVNPQFKDTSRNVASFASAYLGLSAANGAWATGQAYTVGQTVSSAVTGSYFGASYVYRCTAAHTSGSTTIPGDIANTTNWRAYWEPLSLYAIRQAIAAATTYTDATLGVTGGSIIDIFVAWIKDGYAPTNVALHNAGSDGTDIGAVPYQVVLSSIAITAASGSVTAGLTDQFTATATYSDSSTANITSSVTWASASPSVATIASSGLATGVAAGTASISCSLGSITSNAVTLTVTAATIPASPYYLALSKSKTLQPALAITGASGGSITVASTSGWESGDIGLVTGVTGATGVNGIVRLSVSGAGAFALQSLSNGAALSFGGSYSSGGTLTHIGYQTAPLTLDNTIFSVPNPDFLWQFLVASISKGLALRIHANDTGDGFAGDVKPGPTFFLGAGSPSSGILLGARRLGWPGCRMGSAGNALRLNVYFEALNGAAAPAGSSLTFSSWVEA